MPRNRKKQRGKERSGGGGGAGAGAGAGASAELPADKSSPEYMKVGGFNTHTHLPAVHKLMIAICACANVCDQSMGNMAVKEYRFEDAIEWYTKVWYSHWRPGHEMS